MSDPPSPDFVGRSDGPPERWVSNPRNPPPGWYRNPSREPGQRYWDGNQWTGHTAFPPPKASYRPYLAAGLAAAGGIVVGSTGTWVNIGLFGISISGLDESRWGKVSFLLGAISAIVLGAVIIGEGARVNPRSALILTWTAFTAGVYCVAFSWPYILRVLTLPRADVFGMKMGAQVGWGLWLLAFSSVVLAVAAWVAAQQLSGLIEVSGKTSRWGFTFPGRGLPSPATRYRRAAVATSALIALVWTLYYTANWNGRPLGMGHDGTGHRMFVSIENIYAWSG